MLAAPSAPPVGSAPHPAGTGGEHGHRARAREPRALAGLAVALGAAAVALLVHAWIPPASPALLALVVGLGLAVVGAPASLRPGLSVAAKGVLRVGVALLGLQLVLVDVLALGWPVLVVVVAVVAGGLGGVAVLGRALGIDRESVLLVAAGFSICGAAAIAAVDGVRRSTTATGSPESAGSPEAAAAVARAVSLVVVFGSAAMLALPAIGSLLGLSAIESGAWSGAAVQEVGQVVVAGGLVGGAALQVAVVVKLARVLLLAPVLVLLSVDLRSRPTDRPGEGSEGHRLRARRAPVVPFFVVAFVALVALRSSVDVPAPALVAAAWVQQVALAAGMAAVGSALSPAALRSTGARLVVLGALATALVALLGLPAAYLV